MPIRRLRAAKRVRCIVAAYLVKRVSAKNVDLFGEVTEPGEEEKMTLGVERDGIVWC